MAREIARGDIWLLELPTPDKRRPVLVVSRDSLISLLHTVTVAAVTSTLRGSPTEVQLGVTEGLKGPSCVNLCNLFTVEKRRLRAWQGNVGPETMGKVCRALRVATGCEAS
ncbi:MAG TPA: type II toxin-antitoxin system PemK/MazF family toxin [Thermoanaerobaculia bacterium]|nr:type II toxin-antitoxin system PemK/MazF family toxin [Thermoanaerobaculia bacterium]